MGRAAEPVSRDEVAAEFDLPRSTAAFHLDRLVQQGLLDVEFKRLSGRTGPGAGRPAKLYRRAAQEVSVSYPERHYDLAAKLLATAVDQASDGSVTVAEALADAAHAEGTRLGGTANGSGSAALLNLLEEHGFEPQQDQDGSVFLKNCPFHQLIEDHATTVCTMNLHLLRGAACACGTDPESMRLNPGSGRCCVTFHPLDGGSDLDGRLRPVEPSTAEPSGV